MFVFLCSYSSQGNTAFPSHNDSHFDPLYRSFGGIVYSINFSVVVLQCQWVTDSFSYSRGREGCGCLGWPALGLQCPWLQDHGTRSHFWEVPSQLGNGVEKLWCRWTQEWGGGGYERCADSQRSESRHGWVEQRTTEEQLETGRGHLITGGGEITTTPQESHLWLVRLRINLEFGG